MEVRVIDPKNPDEQHHAGKVLGTVIRLVPPARHVPAPNPYRFLIDRALNEEAGKAETVRVEEKGNRLYNRVSTHAPDPSTKEGEVKQWKHQKFGNREHRKSRNEDQEAKGGSAQAGLSGMSQRQATGQVQVVRPRSIPASLSESSHHAEERKSSVVRVHPKPFESDFRGDSSAPNHQNAGIVRADSRATIPSCQSAPGYPAPNSNHPNAEAVEATYPPIDSLFGKSRISSSSARPAPNPTEPTDLGTRLSPRDRGSRHFLSRLIDKLMEHSAYNNPDLEMTNWGWRKKV